MSSFKLERSVSLGIILTLAVQSAGALMWGGAAEARLNPQEFMPVTSALFEQNFGGKTNG